MVIEPQENGTTFELERERLHNSLLNSVSHDLKTPLACIIGSLEIYDRTKDKLSEEKKITLLHTALKEAYRLDGFITNILDMAKLENKTVTIRKEHCSMDFLLEDCLTLLSHHLSECTITIKPIPASFPINTDPLLLMRAICILLDNAAKHVAINPIINVEYEKIGEQVIIRIEDNGAGIPHSKLEEIFSKYARLAIQDHTHSGTGLGLPICREIMRLLDGTVTVANREGNKGSIFTLAFVA